MKLIAKHIPSKLDSFPLFWGVVLKTRFCCIILITTGALKKFRRFKNCSPRIEGGFQCIQFNFIAGRYQSHRDFLPVFTNEERGKFEFMNNA